MSTIPAAPLNYLPYPITQSGHYGFEYDAQRSMEVYLARTSQAVFNILSILDPDLHRRKWRARLAVDQPVTMKNRERLDPLFRRVWRDLPCLASMQPPHFTLGDAALHMPPYALHKILLEAPALEKAPYFGDEKVREFLRSFDAFHAVERAQTTCHHLEDE